MVGKCGIFYIISKRVDRVLGVLTWVIIRKRVTGLGGGSGLLHVGLVGLDGLLIKLLDQVLGQMDLDLDFC